MKARWFALTLAFAGLTPVVSFAGDKSRDTAPAVVTLQYRNFLVTVSAGDNGSLYTVKDAAGKIIADSLSASELQAQLPEVHRFVKEAFAGDRQVFLDASNRVD